MVGITGLHHVTCIAGDPQENLDFYTGVLGMRLVKRTVNQDVPNTYHLFYADGEGHAGTDLTFFPWPDVEPEKPGIGLASEVGLAVPTGSLEYWQHRLAQAGVATDPIVTRFGGRSTACLRRRKSRCPGTGPRFSPRASTMISVWRCSSAVPMNRTSSRFSTECCNQE